MKNKVSFFQTDIGTIIKVNLLVIVLSFVYILYEKDFYSPFEENAYVTVFDFLYSTFLFISISLALNNHAYSKNSIITSQKMGVTKKRIWNDFLKKLFYSYLIIVGYYIIFSIMHLIIYKGLSFINLSILLSFVFMTSFYFCVNFIGFYLGQIKLNNNIVLLILVLELVTGLITIKEFHIIMTIVLALLTAFFYYLNQKKLFKKPSIKE